MTEFLKGCRFVLVSNQFGVDVKPPNVETALANIYLCPVWRLPQYPLTVDQDPNDKNSLIVECRNDHCATHVDHDRRKSYPRKA